MLLSLWGHIHSIPTVGTEQSEQNKTSTLLTHRRSLLSKQENGQLREMFPSTVSQRSCNQLSQIHEAVCEISNLGSKVSPPPPPFSCRKWKCKESFEKLSTAQLTCSEEALFQYMEMRNVQLTGLYQEEVHNKVGGGEEGRQYNAANYTEVFMLAQAWASYQETWYIYIRKLGH